MELTNLNNKEKIFRIIGIDYSGNQEKIEIKKDKENNIFINDEKLKNKNFKETILGLIDSFEEDEKEVKLSEIEKKKETEEIKTEEEKEERNIFIKFLLILKKKFDLLFNSNSSKNEDLNLEKYKNIFYKSLVALKKQEEKKEKKELEEKQNNIEVVFKKNNEEVLKLKIEKGIHDETFFHFSIKNENGEEIMKIGEYGYDKLSNDLSFWESYENPVFSIPKEGIKFIDSLFLERNNETDIDNLTRNSSFEVNLDSNNEIISDNEISLFFNHFLYYLNLEEKIEIVSNLSEERLEENLEKITFSETGMIEAKNTTSISEEEDAGDSAQKKESALSRKKKAKNTFIDIRINKNIESELGSSRKKEKETKEGEKSKAKEGGEVIEKTTEIEIEDGSECLKLFFVEERKKEYELKNKKRELVFDFSNFIITDAEERILFRIAGYNHKFGLDSLSGISCLENGSGDSIYIGCLTETTMQELKDISEKENEISSITSKPEEKEEKKRVIKNILNYLRCNVDETYLTFNQSLEPFLMLKPDYELNRKVIEEHEKIEEIQGLKKTITTNCKYQDSEISERDDFGMEVKEGLDVNGKKIYVIKDKKNKATITITETQIEISYIKNGEYKTKNIYLKDGYLDILSKLSSLFDKRSKKGEEELKKAENVKVENNKITTQNQEYSDVLNKITELIAVDFQIDDDFDEGFLGLVSDLSKEKKREREKEMEIQELREVITINCEYRDSEFNKEEEFELKIKKGKFAGEEFYKIEDVDNGYNLEIHNNHIFIRYQNREDEFIFLDCSQNMISKIEEGLTKRLEESEEELKKTKNVKMNNDEIVSEDQEVAVILNLITKILLDNPKLGNNFDRGIIGAGNTLRKRKIKNIKENITEIENGFKELKTEVENNTEEGVVTKEQEECLIKKMEERNEELSKKIKELEETNTEKESNNERKIEEIKKKEENVSIKKKEYLKSKKELSLNDLNSSLNEDENSIDWSAEEEWLTGQEDWLKCERNFENETSRILLNRMLELKKMQEDIKKENQEIKKMQLNLNQQEEKLNEEKIYLEEKREALRDNEEWARNKKREWREEREKKFNEELSILEERKKQEEREKTKEMDAEKNKKPKEIKNKKFFISISDNSKLEVEIIDGGNNGEKMKQNYILKMYRYDVELGRKKKIMERKNSFGNMFATGKGLKNKEEYNSIQTQIETKKNQSEIVLQISKGGKVKCFINNNPRGGITLQTEDYSNCMAEILKDETISNGDELDFASLPDYFVNIIGETNIKKEIKNKFKGDNEAVGFLENPNREIMEEINNFSTFINSDGLYNNLYYLNENPDKICLVYNEEIYLFERNNTEDETQETYKLKVFNKEKEGWECNKKTERLQDVFNQQIDDRFTRETIENNAGGNNNEEINIEIPNASLTPINHYNNENCNQYVVFYSKDYGSECGEVSNKKYYFDLSDGKTTKSFVYNFETGFIYYKNPETNRWEEVDIENEVNNLDMKNMHEGLSNSTNSEILISKNFIHNLFYNYTDSSVEREDEALRETPVYSKYNNDSLNNQSRIENPLPSFCFNGNAAGQCIPNFSNRVASR